MACNHTFRNATNCLNCGRTIYEIGLIADVARLEAEVATLEKMRIHCERCGADYMATGIEAGCPCLLLTKLKAQEEALERACKLYCTWYDTGQPRMDGAEMAYAMVSAIRVALAALRSKE